MSSSKTARDELLLPPPHRENWQEFLELHGNGPHAYKRFRSIIYHYYFTHQRAFSWRENITPYRIFISEIMLQQTQTSRVQPKFDAFLAAFPDFTSLAGASFTEVLRLWKGLGYNRRARFLKEAAEIVCDQFSSVLPKDPQTLLTLPGIGPATAASIAVFAFNEPHVFIETNIRTVFLHFFFHADTGVDDKEIKLLVEQTLDRDRPRDWYYALMDYGVMLKKSVGNLNRKSRHYTKQSQFQGSDRQLRGQILQVLLDQKEIGLEDLVHTLNESTKRVERIIHSLCTDGLTSLKNNTLKLVK